MKVLKFGGSSVGSSQRIKEVISIVKNEAENDDVLVVVSAFQGVTNILISLGKDAANGSNDYEVRLHQFERIHLDILNDLVSANRRTEVMSVVYELFLELRKLASGVNLLRELSPRTLDNLMSFGERLSALIISAACNSAQLPAHYLDARKVIKTDDGYGNARVLFAETNKLIVNECARFNTIPVVTGFIGSTFTGETTTIGRGGSDYTSSVFAAALKATELQIWTDVDGVMTADPGKVSKAIPIATMSYAEALEMSHFGAKVIFPPTIRPAYVAGIPIKIKNTFNPSCDGTVITFEVANSEYPITGISTMRDIALIKIEGTGLSDVANITGRVFSALAKAGVNIILISQASSGHSICFAVREEESVKTISILQGELKQELSGGIIGDIIVDPEVSIVAAVGENIRNMSGISGKILRALSSNGIEIQAIAQGSSRLNVSLVVERDHEVKALNVIHDTFFLSDHKSINLFIAGTGLIGRTLFTQIQNQIKFLYDELRLEIRIIGIANTRKSLIDFSGIDSENWEQLLNEKGDVADLDTFFEVIKTSGLPNKVFVDCTSSEDVMLKYLDILSSAVSIVTPNKKANSYKYGYYKKLKEVARRYNVHFLFETNVGAGLPIINTLNDLVLSGDKIIRIEGVLSGTLSYIFNTYNGESSFADTVKEAKEKGYTEPDPREDLNGLDVARKLLILVRESGYSLELEDIQLESLIPTELQDVLTTDEFLTSLSQYDSFYKNKLIKAHDNNAVLRYIASYEAGVAKVSLESVSKEHPFYSLSSNDNIVSFTTVYYNERPMIIRGPGAGAKVTSGGVLADIVRIANFE